MEIKVVVCGDSYCSADNTDERWHFSQILKDQYDMRVINLARGGMSNLGICFQIKRAIELKPNVIIYNRADPARVDLIMNQTSNQYSLKEFAYPFPMDSSYASPHVGNADAAIFSTVPQALDQQTHIKVPKEKITAVKYYHAHLFDWQLKFTTDSWWFGYWHEQICRAQILAIDLTSPDHLDQQNPVGKIMYDFVKANPGWPKLYHTDLKTQETVANLLANQIQDHLTKS